MKIIRYFFLLIAMYTGEVSYIKLICLIYLCAWFDIWIDYVRNTDTETTWYTNRKLCMGESIDKYDL